MKTFYYVVLIAQISSIIFMLAVTFFCCKFIFSTLSKVKYYAVVYEDSSYSTWYGIYTKRTKKILEEKYNVAIKSVLKFNSEYELFTNFISNYDKNLFRD